jgi:peptidoglycan L-alanyl-D-glutamate endopeptidase CwlK
MALVAISAVLRSLELKGLSVKVLEGLRSFERQETLYSQGRTTPGEIVTKSPPGHSAHNFGLAADFAVRGQGEPIWRDASSLEMSALAKPMVTWGGSWRSFQDPAHLEMLCGRSLAEWRKQYPTGISRRSSEK